MTTADKVEQLLDEERWSQIQLCYKSHVTPGAINRIIKGRIKEPKCATLERLASAFDVKWTELIAD